MDFKKLLDQLSQIEQESLMERAHIEDVDATADIQDKKERYAALAKLAKSGGYAGMFDPVSGNFIDTEGNAAWIGAYKAEVQQLANHGLIPNAAKEKTSHLLGNMGMDEKEAGDLQKNVRAREQAIKKATGFINKALEAFKTAQPNNAGGSVTPDTSNKPSQPKPADPFAAPTMTAEGSAFRSGLAQALTESFGYNFQKLIEGITQDEHKFIKQVVAQVKGISNDDDVPEFMGKYNAYIQRRDILVDQIRKLVAKVSAKAPVKTDVKESKGNTRGLTERTYLYWEGGNTLLEFHLYYDKQGDLVEYKWTDREDKPFDIQILKEDEAKGGFWQGVSDVGAGAANGLTFGYNDVAVAKLKSLFKGTKYADELHNEFQHTEEIKQRSPILFQTGKLIGQIGGVAGATAMGGPAAGWAVAGAQFADALTGTTDKWHAETDYNYQQDKKTNPNVNPKTDNKPKTPQEGSGMHGAPDPQVKAMQDKLLAWKIDCLPVHHADGRFGKETVAAVKAYAKATGAESDAAAIAKLLGVAPKETPATPAVAKESVIYSSMTEAERMAYIRNKLNLLEVGEAVAAEALPYLARFALGGKNYAWVLAKLGITTAADAEKIIAPIAKASTVLQTTGKPMRSVTVAGRGWQEDAAGVWHAKGSSGEELKHTAQQIASEIKLEKMSQAELQALEHPPATSGASKLKPDQYKIDINTQGSGNTYNIFTRELEASGMAKADAQALANNVQSKGPAALSMMQKITAAGSKLKKFSWNRAFIYTALGLIAFHYMFDDAGNIVPDVVNPPPTPNPNPNPNPKPPVKPDVDNKPTIDPDLEELKELIRQYKEAYPDDPLPADLQAQVDKLLGTSGTDNKPSTSIPVDDKNRPVEMQGPNVDATKLAQGIANGSINPYAGGDVNNTATTNLR